MSFGATDRCGSKGRDCRTAVHALRRPAYKKRLRDLPWELGRSLSELQRKKGTLTKNLISTILIVCVLLSVSVLLYALATLLFRDSVELGPGRSLLLVVFAFLALLPSYAAWCLLRLIQRGDADADKGRSVIYLVIAAILLATLDYTLAVFSLGKQTPQCSNGDVTRALLAFFGLLRLEPDATVACSTSLFRSGTAGVVIAIVIETCLVTTAVAVVVLWRWVSTKQYLAVFAANHTLVIGSDARLLPLVLNLKGGRNGRDPSPVWITSASLQAYVRTLRSAWSRKASARSIQPRGQSRGDTSGKSRWRLATWPNTRRLEPELSGILADTGAYAAEKVWIEEERADIGRLYLPRSQRVNGRILSSLASDAYVEGYLRAFFEEDDKNTAPKILEVHVFAAREGDAAGSPNYPGKQRSDDEDGGPYVAAPVLAELAVRLALNVIKAVSQMSSNQGRSLTVRIVADELVKAEAACYLSALQSDRDKEYLSDKEYLIYNDVHIGGDSERFHVVRVGVSGRNDNEALGSSRDRSGYCIELRGHGEVPPDRLGVSEDDGKECGDRAIRIALCEDAVGPEEIQQRVSSGRYRGLLCWPGSGTIERTGGEQRSVPTLVSELVTFEEVSSYSSAWREEEGSEPRRAEGEAHAASFLSWYELGSRELLYDAAVRKWIPAWRGFTLGGSGGRSTQGVVVPGDFARFVRGCFIGAPDGLAGQRRPGRLYLVMLQNRVYADWDVINYSRVMVPRAIGHGPGEQKDVESEVVVLPDDQAVWEAAEWWLLGGEGRVSPLSELAAFVEQYADRAAQDEACGWGGTDPRSWERFVSGALTSIDGEYRGWLGAGGPPEWIREVLSQARSFDALVSNAWSAWDFRRKLPKIKRLYGKYEEPVKAFLSDCEAVCRYWRRLPEDARAEELPERVCEEALEHAARTGVGGAGRGEDRRRRAEGIVELCRDEHGRWVLERVLCGWVWGPRTDRKRRIHNSLVSWDGLIGGQLTPGEEEKRYRARRVTWINDLVCIRAAAQVYCQQGWTWDEGEGGQGSRSQLGTLLFWWWLYRRGAR